MEIVKLTTEGIVGWDEYHYEISIPPHILQPQSKDEVDGSKNAVSYPTTYFHRCLSIDHESGS